MSPKKLKVRAHTTEAEVTEGRIEAEVRVGNQLVDTLAKLGAKALRAPASDTFKVRTLLALVDKIARFLADVVITTASWKPPGRKRYLRKPRLQGVDRSPTTERQRC